MFFFRGLDSRLFLKSFGVFFFSTLTSSLGTIVDGLVIGNTMNTASVAAYGLISPMNYAFALTGSLLNSGTMNMCAAALGRNKKEEAKRIFSMSFFSGLALSLLGALLITIFVKPILVVLRMEPGTEMFSLAKDYLLAFVIGLPAITATKQLSSVMQLDGDPKRAIYSVVIMTGVNIVGDLLCVKFLPSNLLAIAAVTAFSYYMGLGVLLLHFRKKNIIFGFVLNGLEWKMMIDIIKRGLPKAISRVTSTINSLYINYALMGVGTAAVAGFSVFNSVRFASNAVIFGVGQAMMMLTSIYYGEENRKALMRIWKVSFLVQLLLTGLSFLIIHSLSEVIAIIHLGSNQEAYPFAVPALFWGALGTIFAGINILLADYLQAIRKVWASNMVYILENVVFLVLGILLLWNGTAERVYLGIFLSHVLMTLVIPVFIMVKNRKAITSPEDILMVDKDFGVSPDQEILVSAENVDEVLAASRRVSDFCREKQVASRKAYFLSLAVEEFGTNIITHGFKNDKENNLTIRLMIKNDVITLIFRDDCGYFDPVERYKYLEDPNPETNIGIRMMMKMAEDITYSSASKLNNLIIRI